MPVKQIRLVDDSNTDRHPLSQMLARAAYAVRTAGNGDEAQRCLAEDSPDRVLMDVVMPGRNRFRLTRNIPRNPKFADMPVITCSSKNQETDRVWSMRQDARGYMFRPINRDELFAKIKAFD